MSDPMADKMRRLPPEIARWADLIAAVSRHYGVEAASIAAVIRMESAGNPQAASFDGGHGKGLMQIDDRYHDIAKTPDIFDPWHNVGKGTSLLLGNLAALGNDYLAAFAAYNAPMMRVKQALLAIPPEASRDERIRILDTVTFPQPRPPGYVARVDAYRTEFCTLMEGSVICLPYP